MEKKRWEKEERFNNEHSPLRGATTQCKGLKAETIGTNVYAVGYYPDSVNERFPHCLLVVLRCFDNNLSATTTWFTVWYFQEFCSSSGMWGCPSTSWQILKDMYVNQPLKNI